MTKNSFLLAIVLLAAGALFAACVLEYDFDRAPPWRNSGGALAGATDATGSAQGWGGAVTVTLDLVNGNIENVRI
ncbi:MAG: hypothetical protein FWC65_04295, partial [Treponema sp.]|nr:hypothetical protein [Treponema sp.]